MRSNALVGSSESPLAAGILTPGGLCNPLQESGNPYK